MNLNKHKFIIYLLFIFPKCNIGATYFDANIFHLFLPSGILRPRNSESIVLMSLPRGIPGYRNTINIIHIHVTQLKNHEQHEQRGAAEYKNISQ